MFEKILIANRGEIACRIIETCRKMGIKTVAVYSQADADAKFRKMADESYCIGEPQVSKSYLDIDKILKVALDSGAQAIHPGYGFLSENAKFAQKVADAGIAFIGPSPDVIVLMGDKILSKQAAKKAGVHVVPGGDKALNSLADAQKEAAHIGYPVLLKAAAGGGGKGMRIARSESELAEALERSQSEAMSSFGDNRVFLEKYVEEPHHIEIQILADRHGNVIHIGERDCSIQRRHQKVIEETPSPFITDKVRQEMAAQAVALSKKVGYESAGTVEFIVDKNQKFYFLEMNTRLQVEHPVTEMVTGIDLVEQMIRVASGAPLNVSFTPKGHAVEARLYAEDPDRGFLPSLGRLLKYREPVSSEFVRIDSGVEEGDLISSFYDPMIGKLIGYGASREDAIAHLTKVLDQLYISGLKTNQGFLSALLNHPKFKKGQFTTHFLEEEFGEGTTFHKVVSPEILCVAAFIGRKVSSEILQEKLAVKVGSNFYDIECVDNVFRIDDTVFNVVSEWCAGDSLFTGKVGSADVCVQVHLQGSEIILSLPSQGIFCLSCAVFSAKAAALLKEMPQKQNKDEGRYLLSPMSGLILSVSAKQDQEVYPGEPLAVIEAMKMENVLCAQDTKRVHKILINPGDNVDVDQPLIEFVA